MKRSLQALGADLSGSDLAAVSGLAETFGSLLPLSKLSFIRQSAEGVEPKVFLYKIEAVDGRIWKQVITFDQAPNPFMTFDVADPWRLSEFSGQRTLRNALVGIVPRYPLLERIVYDYQAGP